MDAIVSGSANVAVLVDGDTLRSLRRTAAGVERASLRPGELRYLFGDARDLAFLDRVDEAAVLRELDLAQAGVQALHLALMLCDPKTSDRAAALAAGEIEALLARAEVAERAERILDAKPLPESFVIDAATARCRGHARAAAFFAALADRQPTIREVRRVWDVLPGSLFERAEDRRIADGTLAREGLFRSLVRARVANASIDRWLADAERSPAVLRLRGERWLEAWVEPFRTVHELAADPELGKLLVVLSSRGEMEVAECLRGLDPDARDRVLDALARALRHRTEERLKLARAILRVLGGMGDIGQRRIPPTPWDQRWAGKAARYLAPDSDVVVEQCDRLEVPAKPVRKTKAPHFALGRRAPVPA